MSDIQAIPTEYHGVYFRSRLEARWAIFFDTLKLQWEYEPTALRYYGKQKPAIIGSGLLDAYTPDFYLPEKDLWIEVKPIYPDHQTMVKLASFVIENPTHERKNLTMTKSAQKPAPYVETINDIEKAYAAAQREEGIVRSIITYSSDLLLLFGKFFVDNPILQLWKHEREGLSLTIVDREDIFGQCGKAIRAAHAHKF